ncbi:MAG: MarR family transcriptional regulator [Acidimicrobiales bacterium]
MSGKATTDDDSAETPLDPELVSRLRLAVMRLARRMRQQGNQALTPSQLSTLSTIERDGPLTLGRVAELENVQPPSVSRIVGALEGDGLVERMVHETDRRSALVAITPAGEGALEAIRSDREAWLGEQVARLTPGERRRLDAALPVLERLLGSTP